MVEILNQHEECLIYSLAMIAYTFYDISTFPPSFFENILTHFKPELRSFTNITDVTKHLTTTKVQQIQLRKKRRRKNSYLPVV